MKIFNKDFIINLEKSILWQYDKAENLKSLIIQKQAWYKKNVTDFIMDFFNNIFNIRTANDFGLSVWGKLLNFNRQVVNKNDGTIINLSTEQYRFLLLGQVLKFKMSCTVPEINRYLKLIFNDTENKCYVVDNKDMSIQYVIEAPISDEIQTLIDNVDFLPRPAGVQTNLNQTLSYVVSVNIYDEYGNIVTDGADITFEIDGVLMKTGNEITVETGKTVKITVSKDGYYSQERTYQNIQNNITADFNLSAVYYTFAINATPQDAVVVINGEQRNTIDVTPGTSVTWSVSKTGFVTQSGTDIVTAHTTKNITLSVSQHTFTVTPTPATSTVVLSDGKGQTVSGTGKQSITVDYGTTVGWTVSATGYTQQSGSQLITEDTNKTVSLNIIYYIFKINTNPSNAVVSIDGVVRTDKQASIAYGRTVSWSVTCTGYQSQSGSQSITQDTIKDIVLTIENQNLSYTSDGKIKELFTTTFDVSQKVYFKLSGARSSYENIPRTGSTTKIYTYGGVAEATLQMNAGDTISIKGISGGRIINESTVRGGAGIGLWVNGICVLVAGGAARTYIRTSTQTYTYYAGGGGYNGGAAANTNIAGTVLGQFPGLSFDGQNGTNNTLVTAAAYGGRYNTQVSGGTGYRGGIAQGATLISGNNQEASSKTGNTSTDSATAIIRFNQQ